MALTKITTGEITDGTIATVDVADNAITAAKISGASAAPAGTFLKQDGTFAAVDTAGLQSDIALLAFKTQSNGSLAKYNLVDQTVDSFMDGSGVDAAASSNEIRSSGNYYTGVAQSPTGGAITTHGSYTVHTFLADGTFTVNGTGSGTTVDYLVVAGGGAGGGGAIPGGGGAGGFRTATGHTVSANAYSITVGAGGIGNGTSSDTSPLKNGGDSIFDTITSTGGGGGGSGGGGPAAPGGSGGGSHGYADAQGAGNTPSTSPSQGNPGGPNSHPAYGAGGGGGASATGSQPPQGQGGPGGAGTANDFRTGSNVTYAGGGGGARHNSGNGGPGGAGGGGNGKGGSYPSGVPGTANTGGGGGGDGDTGSNGGSGIVVLRFTTGSLETAGQMTLISNATTASAQPTKGDIVLTYNNGLGSTTINTDLIASISRDGGTTYTDVTLVGEGATAGHNIATAHNVDISGQPAGTSMRWKVRTLNQTLSKETRLQAVSLGWS